MGLICRVVEKISVILLESSSRVRRSSYFHVCLCAYTICAIN